MMSLHHLHSSLFTCVCVHRQAKRLLIQIVERCRNGPGFHGDSEGGASVQEMLIPASKVGLVIGRGGDTIKQLQVSVLDILELSLRGGVPLSAL